MPAMSMSNNILKINSMKSAGFYTEARQMWIVITCCNSKRGSRLLQ